jgi:hypothetical protein
MSDPGTSRATGLANLASQQFGLVTLEQLHRLGVTPSRLRGQLRRETLVRVVPGVYAVAGSPRSWEQLALGSCLGLGADAVLSHHSAARAWKLDMPDSASLHVTLPHDCRYRRATRDLVVHRTRVLRPGERTRFGRLPVTSIERTIVDLAPEVASGALGRLVDDALCRRLVTPARLLEAADTHGGRRRAGVGQLRHVIQPWLGGTQLESVAEASFLRAITEAGLPPPAVQHVVKGAGARTDFAWPPQMVVLEVDGFRWHANPRSHARDSERSNRLAASGWIVLHATPSELATGLSSVIAALRQHLSAGPPVSLFQAGQ